LRCILLNYLPQVPTLASETAPGIGHKVGASQATPRLDDLGIP
jgi:hypothetical protein